MNPDEIHFTWDGVAYVTDMSFLDTRVVMLPDGAYLIASVWFETIPPTPMALKQLGKLPDAFSVAKRAPIG